MSVEVRWKSGYHAKIDVAVAFSVVEEIRRLNGGVLTPESIVSAATPKQSPLHDAFEFDDPTAAHLFRIDQARKMAQSFMIVDTESGTEAPAFVNVKITEAGEGSRAYVPIATVISTPDLRDCAVREALAGLLAWQKRHGMLSGFEPVNRAIDEVKQRLPQKRRGRSGKAREGAAGPG